MSEKSHSNPSTRIPPNNFFPLSHWRARFKTLVLYTGMECTTSIGVPLCIVDIFITPAGHKNSYYSVHFRSPLNHNIQWTDYILSKIKGNMMKHMYFA